MSMKLPAMPDMLKGSLTDIGHYIATHTDASESMGRALAARFPTGISKEAETAIKGGFIKRKAEITASAWYEKVGADSYIALEAKPAKVTEAHLELNVAKALSYTPVEFGKLGGEHPNLHGMVKGFRDATSCYVSKKWARLNEMIRRATAKPATRKTNSWSESADKILSELVKRAASAQKRGDDSAPDKGQVQKMIAAFWGAKK